MQKRIIIILMVICISIPVFSQSLTYDQLVEDFEAFADGVATTLPFNSTLGLNWSDAYIGQFPHFGVGLTTGVTFLPFGSIEDTLDGIGVNLNDIDNPDVKDLLEGVGMPFPAIALEGRIGGFILPFDIGAKIGFISPEMDLNFMEGIVLDYLLIGADVRFRVLKGLLAIPTVSVGGGFTYQYGSFDIPGLLGGDQDITDIAGSNTITLTDPNLNFNWKTFVIDVKAQASWNFFILTPYVGAGMSYAPYAVAGGGMKSDVLFNGTPITSDQIDAIEQYYDAAGEDAPDLTGGQLLVSASTPAAWSLRAFAGVSFNLAILKLDLLGLYNVASGALGASLNFRVQF